MESKQVIVVRKDIEMPKGKMAAQVSHASLGCILKVMRQSEDTFHFETKEDCGISNWLNGSFTKITLYCNNLVDMMNIDLQARNAGLVTCVIEDEGRTVFNNEPTYTCLGIGPDFVDNFEGITDHLKMIRN
ncbi:peptidyl-tRNA hydrolase-like protein [Salicola phage SCTP-2]|nr:peptidyl-tRNA hydrolase-like protein [Salicola phage SCTP-2]